LHAGVTLGRASLGFALATIAGVLIGVAMARSTRMERQIEPIFSFGYPIPKVALYPIFIFLLGVGTLPKVALTFLECLYPIAVNTYFGVKAVDRLHVWLARTVGAGSREIFWRVLIPTAAPYIFSSLRVAASLGLVVVTILEMIGDSFGLGYYMTYAAASFEFADYFAGLIAVLLMGFVLDRIIIALRDRVVFWERGSQDIL
jgi:ABC-type nitrate/sulfonate/bicarbonate transport system permease component